MQNRKYKEYALYKGDEFIVAGTLKEIAKHQNIKEQTVLFYRMPAYLKRREKSKTKNYKVLINLEGE